MKTIKRKPDLETESFRAWVTDIDKKKGKNAIIVKYKDREYELLGFNIVKYKKEDVLAFKIKKENENLFVLYYLYNGENSRKALEELKEAIDKELGYDVNFVNVLDTFKNVKSQEHIIDKL